MLLAYEWPGLLRDGKNEQEVMEILEYLDRDVVTNEVAEEMKRRIERLREIGELDIYEKIK